MTTTTSEDQREVVCTFVHVANYWLGPMPPDLDHKYQLPERLDGFCFSLFPELEGAGNLPQMRLTPKLHPDVNLVNHDMHDTWPDWTKADNTFVRAFMVAVMVVLSEVKTLDVDRREAMGRLAVAVCRIIEHGYVLRAELFNDDEFVGLGEDVAPGLAEAFKTTWDRGEN